MFTGFRKPVLITGSQRPLSAIRSDARSNLVNAVELATMEIPEVAICFDNKLYRGNRTKKISIESYRGFESPNYPLLASIGLRIQLHPENFLNALIPHRLEPKIDPETAVIHLFPGIRTEAYHELLGQPIRSVIIAGFGAGNFPVLGKKWHDFISACTKAGKIVCITSQSPHGRVDPELYETGKQALDAGAVGMNDMTLESSIVKLMILQGNLKERGKIISMLQRSLAGEMTIES